MNDYYRARVAKHAQYLSLDNQAYRLLQHLSGTRLATRAHARWERRRAVVRALGMDARQIQGLNTGDTVHWRGQILAIADWQCHRDPVFAADGARIWAEPMFQGERGQPVYIAPSFWHELV